MDGKTKTEKKIGYLHLVKKKLLTTSPPVRLSACPACPLVHPVRLSACPPVRLSACPPVQLVRLSACPLVQPVQLVRLSPT
jgi:hypothetical protein